MMHLFLPLPLPALPILTPPPTPVINIAIGLSLFEDNLNITTVAPSLAIFLAFIGFFVAVITFGFVFYTLLAIIKGEC